ncbi:endo-1,4-beta-xylanase 1-like [Branchiostoma floridae]|uniref:Endo-1,4-beta-xylanase 1-like n=1 Tax=Branchiostoma floridae TaxID=7739 RepID=A0A9J7HWB3_BRAFL|nr:endo-1,4-beta-xylanase 1-like [Branchiostoma floridae]
MLRAVACVALFLCCWLHDVGAAPEIFRNAGFEGAFGADNWYCSGCTGERHTDDKVEGAASMMARGRTAIWAGPSYVLPYRRGVLPGQTYEFQIFVKLLAGGAAHVEVKVNLATTFADGDVNYRQMKQTDHISQSHGWQRIATTWTVPSFDKEVTSMRLYLEGPPVDTDILTLASELSLVENLQTVSGSEMVTNPGLEGDLSGWYCMSCTGVHYTQYTHDGGGAMLAQDRTAEWAGPSQDLAWGSAIKSGYTYMFTMWVKVLDGGSTTYNVMAKLNIGFKDGTQSWLNIVSSAVSAADGWTRLSAGYTVDDYGDTVSSVRLYAEGPPADVRFLIDDVSLLSFMDVSQGDWKSEANTRIEQLRKRYVTLRVQTPNAQGISVEISQTKSHFAFGSAVNAWRMPSDSRYANFFFDNFEWAVLESNLKWKQNEPQEGQLEWTRADRTMQMLESRGVSIRGHCVFWAVPDYVPDWLKGYSAAEVEQKCWKRVDDVVGRYAGRLAHWDVNNEMLHGSFFRDKTGSSQIRYEMFRKVKEKDPSAKLFLNDYNVVTGYWSTRDYANQITEFINNGAPVEGVGAQGHFGGRPNPTNVLHCLNTLSSRGLPVWITELDINEPDEYVRADGYEDSLTAFFSHPGVEGVLLWGFWDQSHWKPDAALVNGDSFQINEAGRRWQRLVFHDWRTNLSLTDGIVTPEGKEFIFRGFHGNYEVTVKNHGQVVATKTFYLSPGAGSLTVDVDMPNDIIVG